MARKILLVDDDPELRSLLQMCLQPRGFEVLAAENGTDALRQAYNQHPDIVLLDIMMPGMDGWETCARLRELSDVPVIMLTARATEADKLRGFRIGADDYVTKPFSPAEIVARIESVLSRVRDSRDEQRRVFRIGQLTVDVDRRQVRLNEEIVQLTPTEFRVLHYLVERGEQAVSNEELSREIWGRQNGNTSVVRRYISLLRKKLEADPARPAYILNVRGFGYRIAHLPLRHAAE